jgi:cation:H+ antiporter
VIETLIIFAVGLLVMFKASEWVIDTSIDIAKIMRVSTFAVGFVLISVATSLPELVVSSVAANTGSPGIALGNVIGSNIADIALVLGITAMLGLVAFRRASASENAGILFLVSIIPVILMGRGALGFTDGLVLILIFVFYAYLIAKRGYGHNQVRVSEPKIRRVLSTYAKFFASIGLVIVSAAYVVSSGADIARFLKVPESFIGLSLIAFGTSMPELSVNIQAMRKRRPSIAVGNILGSCVTNLTLVLGIAAVIRPLSMNLAVFSSSILFLMGLNAFLWWQISRGKLTKTAGVAMVIAYLIFLAVEGGIIRL